MIPIANNVRIWIATGHTDMRRGMQGLALLVQEGLGRNPFGGDVFVFRGRNGSLIKALWHDGIGLSLYAKRLDRGQHRGHAGHAPERTAALELAASASAGPRGGMKVAAPSYVFTISRVAELLGEDEDWLREIAMDMEPEDGCLTVYGLDDMSTIAFTRFGIECLQELVRDRKR